MIRRIKRSGRPKVFEDADLEALSDENSSQTQKQMTEALNGSQAAISYRLNELNDFDMERRLTMYEKLLVKFKGKSFLPRIGTGDEK